MKKKKKEKENEKIPRYKEVNNGDFSLHIRSTN